MKMRLSVIAVAAALLLAPVIAQDFDVELQRAIQKEAISGDLKAAIQEYKRIADAARDRGVKARALLRMADAHRKMGDAEARRVYEEIIRDFADQSEAVEMATARLSAISASGSPRATPTARRIWDNALGSRSPSNDGRFFSFTDWETGDLAIRDLAAGTSRRVTNTGGWTASGDYAEESVISPDGRWIAYSWFVGKPADGVYYELRLVSTAGSAKPRVLHHDKPTDWLTPLAWTPDGTSVVAYRSRNDGESAELVSVRAADASLRVLSRLLDAPAGASVSPDGRYLVFDAPAGPKTHLRDIVLLPMDLSRPPRPVEHAADDSAPTWSSDGSHVLFISDRGNGRALWSIAVSNGDPAGAARLIDASVGHINGVDRLGRLYFTRGGRHTNVHAAPVSTEMKVTGPADTLSDRFVNIATGGAWSPDGRFFAYYARRLVGAARVVIRTMATREEREITPSLAITVFPAAGLRWFPDGKSLLIVGRELESPPPGLGIFRMDVSTGLLSPITRSHAGGPSGSHPSLSPDGRTLYYIDRRDGDTERIVAFDIARGTAAELRTGGIRSLCLSPRGDEIAYLAQDGDRGRASVTVMSVRGGETRTVFSASDWFDGSRFGTLGWSRDGGYVFFVPPHASGAPNELWRVPAAGGKAESTGIASRGRIKTPDEFPGGGRISYSVLYEQPSELWVLENFLPTSTSR